MSWNKNLIFSSLVAVIGSGFQHGYHTGATNIPKDVLTNWTSEAVEERSGFTPKESTLILLWGVASSLYCLGGVVGGLLSGPFANIFGRKNGLFVNNIVAVFGLIFLCDSKVSTSFEMFVIGRFVIGINSGLNGGICPMYLNEISPVKIRGAIGCMYQLLVTISILIAQVAGMNFTLGTNRLWPLIFDVSAFVIIFQSIALLFCPESPKYLLASKNDDEKAEKSLSWLRGGEDVSDEMTSIKAEIVEDNKAPVTLKQLFTISSLRKPLIISVAIMAAQQLSGINTIIFYSTHMFQDAGLKGNEPCFATIGMGATNAVMSVVSLFLVETAGRKRLLLIGFIGLSVDTFLMFVFLLLQDITNNGIFGYLSIIVIIIFMVAYGIGIGSIPWFIVGELFNQSARPLAYSMAVATNWFVNFLVILAFGPLHSIIHGYVFLIFAVINALCVVFVIFQVPETRNKTVEEVQAMFK